MKYFFTTKVKIVLVTALLLSAALAVIGSLTGMNPGDLLVKGDDLWNIPLFESALF